MRVSPRWLTAVLALFVALALQPLRAADADNFLPADTRDVSSVNIRQILDSSLVKQLGLEQLKAMINGNPTVQGILTDLGFDPFKDVESITLSGTAGAASDNKLIVVRGTFDTAKFEAKGKEVAKEQFDQLKLIKAGDATLYQVVMPEGKDLFVTLVDKKTIAAAPKKEMVLDVLAQRDGKKTVALKDDIVALLKKADHTKSFWFAGTVSEDVVNNPFLSDEKVKDAIKKIKTVHGGINITEDVKLEFVFGGSTADSAKDVAEVLTNGIALGKQTVGALGEAKLAPVKELLESLKVTTNGSNITLTGSVSKAALTKSLN